jgi:photosystem II stability/assembly factor-like uncharacterized protein
MNRIILLLLILILSANNLKSQGTFTQQKTHFTDSSSGVVVDQISVVDENIVWVKGYKITNKYNNTGVNIKDLSRTNNGGSTWTEVNMPQLGINELPSYIRALSYNDAFAFVYDTVSFSTSLWQTANGGVLWNIKTNIFNSTGSYFDGVNFWDSIHGFCYGEPIGIFPNIKFEIYYTSDGGNTWNLCIDPPAPTPLTEMFSFGSSESSTIINGGVAFIITSKGRVLKTNDYGISWNATVSNPFSLSAGESYLFRVYASSENFIICSKYFLDTPSGTWKYSTDGGATWNNYLPTGTFRGYTMSYLPGTPDLFVGASPLVSNFGGNGASYCTTSTAWSTYTDVLLQRSGSNLPCFSVGFADQTTGWIGVYDSNSSFNTIVKYYNPTIGIKPIATVYGDDVNIYPNPSTGILNFSVNGTGKECIQIKVIDVLGNIVFSEMTDITNQSVNSFDLSSYSKGIYFVIMNSGNSVITKKIILN